MSGTPRASTRTGRGGAGPSGGAGGGLPGGVSVGEAAVVTARYDLRPVVAVRALRGGQAARLDTDQGSLLLKRRPAALAEHTRACHRLTAAVEAAGLPVTRPIPDRNGETVSIVGSWAYDIARWIEGRRFDESPEQAAMAGAALARVHRALGRIGSSSPAGGWSAPMGRMPLLSDHLMARGESGVAAADVYNEAWDRMRVAGCDRWPTQVLHGDWHRGNVLFDDAGRVAAILDFDEARLGWAMGELCEGAVQFATRAPRGQASDWPAETDEACLGAFIGAYRGTRGADGRFAGRLGRHLLRRRWRPGARQASVAAWLMGQSLVSQAWSLLQDGEAELARPGEFLDMVTLKARWLTERSSWIEGLLRD